MTKELEANTTVSHYRIVSKLGAGGMGEVYLAQDTKLDRKVAIKFLNEEFSKDEDKLNRFIREAKAASALNHPNILTVYEIGEVDGRNYIATELIDGHTLRQHLAPKEPLPLNTILKIGVQVAEGLSAAHQAGIIHRDIKPENIMIRRDGYAKVLDFGLAKLSEPGAVATGSSGAEDPTRIQVNTNPGVIMGTVSYMSPEQARGNSTDARTDIWSLGVVLYEMLARKVPFTGDTTSHAIVSILEKEPLALENVPAELQRIVRKTLTKDADMRYQSARDLLIDLKNLRRELDIQGELERSMIPNRETAAAPIGERATQVHTSGAPATRSEPAPAATHQLSSASSLEYAVTQARSHKLTTVIVGVALLAVITTVVYFAFLRKVNSTAGQIQSIAVMPFVNESGNQELEYLSDGMTESLINGLSQLPNLSVKARSTVFHYKGKGVTPQQVGSELYVQAVLNGRVTQHADQMTLSLELVDARTGNQIWGEQYSRKATDLVVLQNQIARDVANSLKTKLSKANEAKLAKTYTANPEAYNLYLQGVFYWNKLDARKSIECLNRAIVIDPNYALAYSGLGDSYLTLLVNPGAVITPAVADETLQKSRAAASKALELDPDLPEAHALMALLSLMQDHDFAGCERELNRALELNPNYAEGHRRNGLRLFYLGQFEAARTEFQKALDIDPLSSLTNFSYASTFLYEGRYDEAEARIRKNREMDPGFLISRGQLSTLYRLKGNYAAAVEESAKTSESQNLPEVARLKRDSFAKGGWPGYLRALATEYEQKKLNPYLLAIVYADLGEKDKAFGALDDVLALHSNFVGYFKIDPQLNPLRDDPRFTALLKKSGFPQ
jgi:serine/threonine protein kinase/tetratricopeptide (TPR) repeat protein